MPRTRPEIYKLTLLWLCFGLYATFFPPITIIAGKFLQKATGDWRTIPDIAYPVLAELPFLQALAFGFFATTIYDLMQDKHYPGDWQAFGVLVVLSVLLVAIGFYSAVSTDTTKQLSRESLVIVQSVITMASVGFSMLLKYSQLSS